MSLKIKERLLIIFSFVFIPNSGVSQVFSANGKRISSLETKSHPKCLKKMGAAGDTTASRS